MFSLSNSSSACSIYKPNFYETTLLDAMDSSGSCCSIESYHRDNLLAVEEKAAELRPVSYVDCSGKGIEGDTTKMMTNTEQTATEKEGSDDEVGLQQNRIDRKNVIACELGSSDVVEDDLFKGLVVEDSVDHSVQVKKCKSQKDTKSMSNNMLESVKYNKNDLDDDSSLGILDSLYFASDGNETGNTSDNSMNRESKIKQCGVKIGGQSSRIHDKEEFSLKAIEEVDSPKIPQWLKDHVREMNHQLWLKKQIPPEDDFIRKLGLRGQEDKLRDTKFLGDAANDYTRHPIPESVKDKSKIPPRMTELRTKGANQDKSLLYGMPSKRVLVEGRNLISKSHMKPISEIDCTGKELGQKLDVALKICAKGAKFSQNTGKMSESKANFPSGRFTQSGNKGITSSEFISQLAVKLARKCQKTATVSARKYHTGHRKTAMPLPESKVADIKSWLVNESFNGDGSPSRSRHLLGDLERSSESSCDSFICEGSCGGFFEASCFRGYSTHPEKDILKKRNKVVKQSSPAKPASKGVLNKQDLQSITSESIDKMSISDQRTLSIQQKKSEYQSQESVIENVKLDRSSEEAQATEIVKRSLINLNDVVGKKPHHQKEESHDINSDQIKHSPIDEKYIPEETNDQSFLTKPNVTNSSLNQLGKLRIKVFGSEVFLNLPEEPQFSLHTRTKSLDAVFPIGPLNNSNNCTLNKINSTNQTWEEMLEASCNNQRYNLKRSRAKDIDEDSLTSTKSSSESRDSMSLFHEYSTRKNAQNATSSKRKIWKTSLQESQVKKKQCHQVIGDENFNRLPKSHSKAWSREDTVNDSNLILPEDVSREKHLIDSPTANFRNREGKLIRKMVRRSRDNHAKGEEFQDQQDRQNTEHFCASASSIAKTVIIKNQNLVRSPIKPWQETECEREVHDYATNRAKSFESSIFLENEIFPSRKVNGYVLVSGVKRNVRALNPDLVQKIDNMQVDYYTVPLQGVTLSRDDPLGVMSSEVRVNEPLALSREHIDKVHELIGSSRQVLSRCSEVSDRGPPSNSVSECGRSCHLTVNENDNVQKPTIVINGKTWMLCDDEDDDGDHDHRRCGRCSPKQQEKLQRCSSSFERQDTIPQFRKEQEHDCAMGCLCSDATIKGKEIKFSEDDTLSRMLCGTSKDTIIENERRNGFREDDKECKDNLLSSVGNLVVEKPKEKLTKFNSGHNMINTLYGAPRDGSENSGHNNSMEQRTDKFVSRLIRTPDKNESSFSNTRSQKASADTCEARKNENSRFAEENTNDSSYLLGVDAPILESTDDRKASPTVYRCKKQMTRDALTKFNAGTNMMALLYGSPSERKPVDDNRDQTNKLSKTDKILREELQWSKENKGSQKDVSVSSTTNLKGYDPKQSSKDRLTKFNAGTDAAKTLYGGWKYDIETMKQLLQDAPSQVEPQKAKPQDNNENGKSVNEKINPLESHNLLPQQNKFIAADVPFLHDVPPPEDSYETRAVMNPDGFRPNADWIPFQESRSPLPRSYEQEPTPQEPVANQMKVGRKTWEKRPSEKLYVEEYSKILNSGVDDIARYNSVNLSSGKDMASIMYNAAWNGQRSVTKPLNQTTTNGETYSWNKPVEEVVVKSAAPQQNLPCQQKSSGVSKPPRKPQGILPGLDENEVTAYCPKSENIFSGVRKRSTNHDKTCCESCIRACESSDVPLDSTRTQVESAIDLLLKFIRKELH